MPRFDPELPEPWVNLKLFSSEERQEIISKGWYVIPVNYRYNHLADCIVDQAIGKQISSIQRGIRDRTKLDYIPPVLFGSAGSARPPRILVTLPLMEEVRPMNPNVPGSPLHKVMITEQRQWLLSRLVMMLYMTPPEVLPALFDGTVSEPILPYNDITKATLLVAAMQNVPLVRFLNGNVHDCRILNLECKTQSRGNNARDQKSIQRRQDRQRMIEELGLRRLEATPSVEELAAVDEPDGSKSKFIDHTTVVVPDGAMSDPNELKAFKQQIKQELDTAAIEKLKALRHVNAKSDFLNDPAGAIHVDPTLPAVQPIFQRHKSGQVTVVSEEDDANPQIIDMARILAENEARTREATGEKSSAEKYSSFVEGLGTSKASQADASGSSHAEPTISLDLPKDEA